MVTTPMVTSTNCESIELSPPVVPGVRTPTRIWYSPGTTAGEAVIVTSPVIESTGTGGGFKLFCGGIGVEHPDIANASRPIKESERAACAEAGVEAVTATTRSVYYSRLDLNIVLVPHRSTIQGPGPLVEPNPDARWNVLVAYGSVDREESVLLSLNSADWDYVALGHEHFRRELVPGVHYAGALERVGATPWEEAAEEKGFLTYDLESRQVRFHPIHGRPVVSLEPIPFEADRPERLRERVGEVLVEVPGGIEEKIVRIRIQGLPAQRLDLLNGVLPEYRRRALHLEVQLDDEPLGHLGHPTQEMKPSTRLASRLAEHLAGLLERRG